MSSTLDNSIGSTSSCGGAGSRTTTPPYLIPKLSLCPDAALWCHLVISNNHLSQLPLVRLSPTICSDTVIISSASHRLPLISHLHYRVSNCVTEQIITFNHVLITWPIGICSHVRISVHTVDVRQVTETGDESRFGNHTRRGNDGENWVPTLHHHNQDDHAGKGKCRWRWFCRLHLFEVSCD